jgi:hypothetical protein
VAVRAIRKNKGIVVVEPIARVLTVAKRFAPWLIDWGLHLGTRRHTRRRLLHARRLKQQQHRDEETAERAVA